MVEGAFACVFLFFCGVFSLMFFVQRKIFLQKLRARQEPGFYPSTRDLGNALHTLQIFAQPRIAYVQEAKLKQPQEEDDSGDDTP